MAATVKGSVVTSAYEYMRDAFGEDTWGRVIERLSPEDLVLVRNSSRTAKFPVATDGRVMSALVDIQFGGNRAVAEQALRAGGAFQADVMLRGVFSVFARLASPDLAFSRAGSIITSVYDGVGHRTVPFETGKGGLIHITGLGESCYVAPWQCGWMERALNHFGSESPRVIERCWQSGRIASDELVYELTF